MSGCFGVELRTITFGLGDAANQVSPAMELLWRVEMSKETVQCFRVGMEGGLLLCLRA